MNARLLRWSSQVGTAVIGGSLGLLLLGAVSAAAQNQPGAVPEGAVSAQAQTGAMGPGRVIEVPSSNVPYAPTSAQIMVHNQVMTAKSQHLAPPLGPHTAAAEIRANGGVQGGVQTDGSDEQGRQSLQTQPMIASDFAIFKNSLINSICPGGCAQSTINEPSVANSGKTVIETSNWNIAYTLNGGANPITWANQSPYALSSGYCCDTQILYNPDRDVFVLLLLDYAGEGASTNGLTLSIARGQQPTSWCTYKFTGASFGEGSTDTLDFPKIAISNNNLFLTWNDYPPNSGFRASGLARMPLDSLAACAGFNFSYLTRSTEFAFALAQNARDQFYWVSNWMLDGTANGRNLRIFRWPDNSGSYFTVTRAINAYTFGTAACGSPNWCSRLDPRYESVVITPGEYRAQANPAFGGDQLLEVAATAGPSGFSNGKNYVVYNYFKLNSLTYIGNDQTYSTSINFAYPSCAVNEKGYVGCAMAQGLNAPGGFIMLQDNVNPTQPWGYNYVLAGINGASEWGDYTFTNPWHPGGGPFQTVLWNVQNGNVQPHYIVWGRQSDSQDYARWSNK